MKPLAVPTLCLVTDRRRACPDARTPDAAIAGLEAWIADAVAAGVDLIQLRERDLEVRVLLSLTRRVARLATGSQTTIVVNDRVDVAAAAGVGVHLRGDGPDGRRVRPLLAAGARVTRAVHASHEAAGLKDSVDAVLFGTVRASRSKPGVQAAGFDALAATVRAAGRTPVLGIGGLNWDDVAAVAARGAAGIAGIGLFLPAAAGGPSDLRGAIAAARAAWAAVS